MQSYAADVICGPADERSRLAHELHDETVQALIALDRPHVDALVLAGALDHFGERRKLLWDLAEAYRLAKRPRELPLHSPDERAQLPPMDRTERWVTAYAATGVSLDAHLTELRRMRLSSTRYQAMTWSPKSGLN